MVISRQIFSWSTSIYSLTWITKAVHGPLPETVDVLKTIHLSTSAQLDKLDSNIAKLKSYLRDDEDIAAEMTRLSEVVPQLRQRLDGLKDDALKRDSVKLANALDMTCKKACTKEISNYLDKLAAPAVTSDDLQPPAGFWNNDPSGLGAGTQMTLGVLECEDLSSELDGICQSSGKAPPSCDSLVPLQVQASMLMADQALTRAREEGEPSRHDTIKMLWGDAFNMEQRVGFPDGLYSFLVAACSDLPKVKAPS